MKLLFDAFILHAIAGLDECIYYAFNTLVGYCVQMQTNQIQTQNVSHSTVFVKYTIEMVALYTC